MTDRFWYPSVEDVLGIHEDIVSEYSDTSPGIHTAIEVVSPSIEDFVRGGRLTCISQPETQVRDIITGLLIDTYGLGLQSPERCPIMGGDARTNYCDSINCRPSTF